MSYSKKSVNVKKIVNLTYSTLSAFTCFFFYFFFQFQIWLVNWPIEHAFYFLFFYIHMSYSKQNKILTQ